MYYVWESCSVFFHLLSVPIKEVRNHWKSPLYEMELLVTGAIRKLAVAGNWIYEMGESSKTTLEPGAGISHG